jgi:hypothetical protein
MVFGAGRVSGSVSWVKVLRARTMESERSALSSLPNQRRGSREDPLRRVGRRGRGTGSVSGSSPA